MTISDLLEETTLPETDNTTGPTASFTRLSDFHTVQKTVVENMEKYKQIDLTIAGHHRANCSAQLKTGDFPDGLKSNLTPLIFKMSDSTLQKWNEAQKELSYTLVKNTTCN